MTTQDSIAPFTSWRNISASEISNNGHTLTITGLNGRGNFAFQLDNKIIPSAGNYTITSVADADGALGQYTSESISVTLVSE